ncbi:hypothetical protein [Robertkochia aurantiaca]|uniref:hypothetical protein n=1 Tax=Robertkochia aurantiaca TaxID=2873700 RepID=UPI001CCAB733|nr:hypothetical protein [Robertkochia sp. 3YJGBD-33]
MKKYTHLLLLFLFVNLINAQETKPLNAYRYVVVPVKYEWQKDANQYRFNTYVKYKFENAGFDVYYSDTRPDELIENPCMGLRAEVENVSGMLTTKLLLRLINCKNQMVFISEEGSTKIKEYEPAYREAFDKAFKDIKKLNYQYDPDLALELSSGQKRGEELSTPQGSAEIMKEQATVEIMSTKTGEQIMKDTELPDPDILYAQKLADGYQLVDTRPKLVFKLRKTSDPERFIITNYSGMFYKEGEYWVAEYYKDGQLVKETWKVEF